MLGYLLSEGEACECSLADLYWVTLGETRTVVYGCESWPIKKLSTEELMLVNCGVGELSWRALALHGDPTNQSQRK